MRNDFRGTLVVMPNADPVHFYFHQPLSLHCQNQVHIMSSISLIVLILQRSAHRFIRRRQFESPAVIVEISNDGMIDRKR